MPTSSQVRRVALIVEDQTTLRELLSELLGGALGLHVVTASTVGEARQVLSRGAVDLLLTDLVLPDAHGFDLLREARGLQRAPRCVVLTAQARPMVVRDASELGAHGVVTKGAPLRELREAIERVLSGGVYYCSETMGLLREAMVAPERTEQLTLRQREIVQSIARGRSTKEIASVLGLSEKTVANHRTRIMERLGVHDVAGLTRYAIAQGLVDPEL
jgi:two-component system nitrate/nitrite response regulator NarL